MSNAKKPAERITCFPISAAIWRNETAKGVYYAIDYERSYKDETGRWHSTSNGYSPSESLLLAKVADLAHTKVCELQANDRRTKQSEDQAA